MNPITRNGFEYHNNQFFAVPSPQTRHTRATILELRTFFNAKASILDQTANWFKAQLMHYGLQPTDHKSTAAARLRDALYGGNFEVPRHVRFLEWELQQEWEEKEKKALNTGKNERTRVKRKAGGEDAFDEEIRVISNVNIRLERGYTNTKVSVREEEVVSQGYLYSSPAPREKKRAMKTEPPAYGMSSNFSPSQRITLGLLNGNYKIDSSDFDTRKSGMILCLDRNTSIWGEFQLGPMEGILFIPQRPYQIQYKDEGGCYFEWRAVDTDTNEGYHGDHCTGEVRFLGDGHVEGTFFNMLPFDNDDCEFWGHRTSGKNEWKVPRDARSMQEEYERIGWGY